MLYILKSAITLALLYNCFFFFLSKETFHRFNRCMLVGIMLTSLIVPLLHFTTEHPTVINEEVYLVQTYIEHDNIPIVTTPAAVHRLTWVQVVAAVYLTGVAAMLILTFVQVFSLVRMLHGGLRHTDSEGNTIVLLKGDVTPFSIFRYIVMNVQDYEQHSLYILTHEQEHIRLGHTYDLLLLEAMKTFQWFNPFVWFISRDLKAVHEYEADQAVIHQGIDAKSYQQLLVMKVVGNRLQPFTNNLGHGSLKKRIIMMYQKKSNRWMMLKALFILPVTCFAIYAFATPEANLLTPQVKKTVATQQQKATPTTQQKKATPATQQQKKAVAATQQKATSNPQKKDVTVQIKTDKENVTGTLQKEKAEQLAKDIKAKLGDKATVTISDSAPSDTIYGVVDELPQFPGGFEAMYKWVGQNLKYPQEAIKNEIQGRVTIQFVVEKDGTISEVKALKSPHKLLTDEAERIVGLMSGKWTPAKNKGEIVRSHFRLPITFRLAPCQPTKE